MLIEPRPSITIRGIYGGVPRSLIVDGSLADSGVNAVWQRSDAITQEDVALLKSAGAHVYAEFNTMHVAAFVDAHPDAAPVGPDGRPSPPPDGWQGVCPTHPLYRRERMDAFRALLQTFELDGVW